jgi:cytochrome c-type biogenesis protein CcmH
MFWGIAAVAIFLGALITFFPLLRGKTFWQPAGLALIFLVPAATLWMYREVGTPEAIGLSPPRPANNVAAHADTAAAHAESAGDMESMTARLRERLEQDPQDIEGWLLLARSYKSMQRFADARAALETAHSIAPDDPVVMVELAEAQIFTSPDGQIGDDSLALLQRALVLDPQQQKALWLLGVAAAQAGEYAYAIEQWESLLAMVEPGSRVAQSLQSQIDQARAELGEAPAAEPLPTAAESGDSDAWNGMRLKVRAGGQLPAELAAQAVLYVMIRSPGPAMGPPIGVRRINGPSLPVELMLTDQDSMLADRKISGEAEVQLQARLSLSGSPAASDGDWQSAPMTVSLQQTDSVELVLDQQVATTE